MDLSRYKVKGVNDTSFRAAFTSMMDVDVQSIVRLHSIRNQIPNVDNCNFPVGFVYFEQGVYYLVGWLPNAKKVHPSGLKPWAKESASTSWSSEAARVKFARATAGRSQPRGVLQ